MILFIFLGVLLKKSVSEFLFKGVGGGGGKRSELGPS